MKHATVDDFDEIFNKIFSPHKKTYFPHIRADYVKREIEKGNVVFENDVVIIYNVYKRKQKIGEQIAMPGDATIKQVVTKTQGSGNAFQIVTKFFSEMNTNVWLTVRSENLRARKFYEKIGMKEVGSISWSDGSIPGTVYVYKK